MAKDRSFAAKMAKGAKGILKSKQCPRCGETLNFIKLVTSEQKENLATWRFREKYVGVCKCNEKEIYA